MKRFITNGDSDIHLALARSEEGTRDATKSPELFEKSMKVYLNMAEAEVAKHYNLVKSLDVAAIDSYKKA